VLAWRQVLRAENDLVVVLQCAAPGGVPAAVSSTVSVFHYRNTVSIEGPTLGAFSVSTIPLRSFV